MLLEASQMADGRMDVAKADPWGSPALSPLQRQQALQSQVVQYQQALQQHHHQQALQSLQQPQEELLYASAPSPLCTAGDQGRPQCLCMRTRFAKQPFDAPATGVARRSAILEHQTTRTYKTAATPSRLLVLTTLVHRSVAQ